MTTTAIEILNRLLNEPPLNKDKALILTSLTTAVHARAIVSGPINPDLSVTGDRRNVLVAVDLDENGESTIFQKFLPKRII